MIIQNVLLAALCSIVLVAPSFAQDSQAQDTEKKVFISPAAGSTHPSLTAAKTAAGPAVGGPKSPNPVTNIDDNENTALTGWWFYSGQSPTDVSNTITNLNARPVDISVDAFSPNYSFSVSYVSNTGSYAKAFWWYYGIDAATLASELSTNNARLITLKAYDVGGGNIRFACVMISNTGADAKGWWYYYGETAAGLGALATTNNARITNVQSYVSAGKTYYAAIMISNTGADEAGWWWYFDETPAQIATDITTDNAQILDITSAGGGNFNVAMVSCATSSGCPQWWYYFGYTAQQVFNIDVQNGARINSVDSYPGCGGLCYDVTMLNDSNEITTRVGNILRSGGVGGVQGLYLQQVGGSVLANLEDSETYEPASSIKVLIHLYAMTQVQNGSVNLNTQIPHNTDGPDSCPSTSDFSGTESLQMALREMMWHSDNARALELTQYFTDAKINAFGKAIGMTNTSINQILGCAYPPDTMTLDDAATLYQQVAEGSILDSNNIGIFYSLMAGKSEFESEGYDFTSIWSPDVADIISQEAPAGYTAAQEKTYQANMDLVYKPGGYVLCQNDSCTSILEDVTVFGWFQVPVCTTGGTSYNQYVFGIYLYDAPDTSWYSGKTTVADTNFNNAKAELMREQIQAGLTACYKKPLDTVSWSPASLKFAKRKVGTTSTALKVTLTNKQKVALTGISISAFGDFTETDTCSGSLATNAKCVISVVFSPSATGERTGAVIVSDSGSGEPQTIELTGTGE
jgi:hypothetical protein